MQHKLLLIEDDPAVSEMVRDYLEKEHYEITPAFDGEEGLRLFKKENFHLVLLDLMLPKLNGIEVLKAIRLESMIPVIITSAKDSDLEKALGLEIGADDYIGKPFSMIELAARIRANLRRVDLSITTAPSFQTKFSHLDLVLNTENFSVQKRGQAIKLTSKEFDLLHLFLKNPKRVFTKEQLYNLIWDDAYYGDENVINVQIRRLREKIEDEPSSPTYIKTVWGIGYKLGESQS